MNQKITRNKIGRMTPQLHGHTKIVFIDKFGRETVKLDKDNLVTDAVQKIFESNYFGSIDYSYFMPAIRKILGGVVCFENTLGNDASNIWIPNSFDNPITAHAGQVVPTSLADDITRGLPNTAASTAVQNGYKMVWNFPETQGNGDISAVGLCHADFGDYALKNSNFQPLEMISNDSIKPFAYKNLTDDNRKLVLNFYDAVNGYSYTFVNDDITIDGTGECFVNHSTTFTVIRRKNTILNNVAVDMNHYIGDDEHAETFTLTYDLGGNGTLSHARLPSIYVDYTNNLLWFSFVVGTASIDSSTKFNAAAFDMTAFADGADLSPVKTQSGSDTDGAILGGNYPLQGMIKSGANGFFPACVWQNNGYKFTLASYDSSNKEFNLENITPIDLGKNQDSAFPENLALGNYFFLRAIGNGDPIVKLVEFDTSNDNSYSYNVTAPYSDDGEAVCPYYIEENNPIIGACNWKWVPATGITMGKSGTAINKLYLATKNDLPATITKSSANSMRIEYTLTYV